MIDMSQCRVSSSPLSLLLFSTLILLSACGGSGYAGGGGAGGGSAPGTPLGLAATPGNQSVSLTWGAVTGASSYNVKRSTVSGGSYSTVASPSTNSYSDTGVTNGTTYYYVVSAVNTYGESANSSQVSATPISSTSVTATINVLANRHAISPYIYGGAFPANTSAITDSGTTVVRWGGNAASTYNWQLFTYNADNDYYFEDFNFFGLGNGNNGSGTDADSTKFIPDVESAGSAPLMTMVMLPWVAQTAETPGTSGNGHWSFPQTEYSNQCAFDPYNTDAGDGIATGSCNGNTPTYVTATTADLNRTYFPLLDDHTQTCTASTCVYRSDWATALAAAFGSTNTCPIPYTPITSCHFYDMDNEIDIWGATHHDVHPNPGSFDELGSIFPTEAGLLKTWDPAAVRLGPVSCCWYFYWRSQTGASDTSRHGGVDFLPWWLNQVAWSDAIAGTRSLDMFDIHAYPDADTGGLSHSQLQALAVKIYRDWWDPTFKSAAGYIVNGGFSIEPMDSNPFRIPRMRALVNQIYPGTAFSITEWSADFASPSSAPDTDFATALADADAYGILGRERVSLSTRWEAPSSSNPNYQALKLFTNYDGSHHRFGTTSVEATPNANPDFFSVYAALNSSGTGLTILVINKDPGNSAQVSFTTSGFTPSGTQTTYTLSQNSPTAIVSSAGNWSATQTFAPYTATLVVVPGALNSTPGADWDLNPDTIMVPASGTVTLSPKITGGTGSVTLSSAVFDAFAGAPACTGGSINIGTATITTSANGAITVNAPGTPEFCHFTATGTDAGGVTQTQGGWIVVGNPAATFTQTGNNQTGAAGSTLTLSVTLNPGQSGGTNTGASVLFWTPTNGATLSNGTTSGPKVIAVTDSSGVASVTLTLPSTAGPVAVTAEGPYGLGHPVATFAETAQ